MSTAASTRDDRSLRFMKHKGAAMSALTKSKAGYSGNTKTMRRMMAPTLGPSREDESKYVSVPGRTVPIGFAKYVSPVVNPINYIFFRLAGWRVAVPRGTASLTTKNLLMRIYKYGPQSAGYVRVGDTLVPGILGPGSRLSLTQSAYYDADDNLPLSS